jgi:hypothetical protein
MFFQKAKAKGEIQQKVEDLYVALSKVEDWQNVSLLQELAAHVKRNDNQWYDVKPMPS